MILYPLPNGTTEICIPHQSYLRVVSDRNADCQLVYRFIALCCNPLAPKGDRDNVNSRHREELNHFKLISLVVKANADSELGASLFLTKKRAFYA